MKRVSERNEKNAMESERETKERERKQDDEARERWDKRFKGRYLKKTVVIFSHSPKIPSEPQSP